MSDDIRAWLDGLGLATYADTFEENGVDTELLPELTNDDLKDLGVARLADRKKILKAIEALAGDAPPAAEPASSPAAAVAAPAPEGERRQVSILFADITGYTKLSSEIDAEQVHTLLGFFFQAADRIVTDHGGRVDKHVGDSVMAVFGAPVAHSDDPVRAARAALAIHEAMPAVSERAGRELRVHIGIASGQVVASGVGGDTHYTVTGDSVNLASRLTDAADSEETLMSAAVQAAVVDAVDCEDRGTLALKGLTEPIHSYALTGLRVSGGRRERAFVGRQAEMHQFTGALDACRNTGAGQVMLVRGEAGIGKTRLSEEFEQAALEQGFASHRALVLDFGVRKGQDAIRTLLRGLLAIVPGSGKADRAAAAERAFADGLLERAQAVFLNDLLDLPQPDDLRPLFDAMDNSARNAGKRAVISALVRARAAQRPLFLMVEDVHWASPLVLDHLAELAQTVADQPAILVMTTRIEGDPIDPAWRAQIGATPLSTIELRPLRREDALALAREYFDATQQFAMSCIERADGNPLFLEQLLRSAETARDDNVPGSVQSIVQARLDALEPLDKLALQAASVLGQRFSLDALRHLIDSAQYTCGALIEKYLVPPQGEDFLFAHALVQEGVYNSLLTARRAELHRAAAGWYGERGLGLRAEHLDRAGDPAAAAAYLDAARAQADQLRFETALRLADRGATLSEDADTTYALTCLRGESLGNVGATEDSITAYEAALAAAAADSQRCRAWIGVAGGLRVADRQQPALEVLEQAEAAAVRQGLDLELAQIHYLRGNVYFPLGNIEGCLGEHEKALALARRVGDPEIEAQALSGLGDAHYLHGHMRTSCEQFRACVDLCREHGLRRIEVANRHMVGWTRFYLMEFRDALDDAKAAIQLATEVSHRRAETLGLMLATLTELELGLIDDSEQHGERALELARAIGAGNFTVQCLVLLARAQAVRNQQAKAKDLVDEAVAVARGVGMAFYGPATLAALAGISEDPQEAAAALREGEEILEAGCVAHNQIWFAQYAIESVLAAGDWDTAERYAERLETYTRSEPMEWPDFIATRARALAAWGRGERGDRLRAEIGRLHDLSREAGLTYMESTLAPLVRAD